MWAYTHCNSVTGTAVFTFDNKLEAIAFAMLTIRGMIEGIPNGWKQEINGHLDDSLIYSAIESYNKYSVQYLKNDSLDLVETQHNPPIV